MTIVIFITVIFAFQLIFESLNILARVAGSIINSNAVGASLDKILSTLKRFFIFAYAPVLGYLIYLGDVSRVFLSIFASIFVGAVSIFLIIIYQKKIVCYFVGVVQSMNKNTPLIESFFSPTEVNVSDYPELSLRASRCFSLDQINTKMFMSLTLVYFVYSSAVFIVNVLALAYTSAAPIILQLLGFINGLATIVMAFVIEPSLARVLETRDELNTVSETFLTAQFVSVIILSPIMFLVLYVTLF